MSLLVNLLKAQEESLKLSGIVPFTEAAFDFEDEVVKFAKPLKYDLLVQHVHDSLLVTGDLELPLQCDCVRCLRSFEYVISIREWACHIPLEGEDQALVVKDSVDLTPYIREDMVLALPTHPVCRNDCPGLDQASPSDSNGVEKAVGNVASPWDELNKLKLKS